MALKWGFANTHMLGWGIHMRNSLMLIKIKNINWDKTEKFTCSKTFFPLDSSSTSWCLFAEWNFFDNFTHERQKSMWTESSPSFQINDITDWILVAEPEQGNEFQLEVGEWDIFLSLSCNIRLLGGLESGAMRSRGAKFPRLESESLDVNPPFPFSGPLNVNSLHCFNENERTSQEVQDHVIDIHLWSLTQKVVCHFGSIRKVSMPVNSFTSSIRFDINDINVQTPLKMAPFFEG